MNYDYTIRGWLSSINKSYVNNGSSTANYFGEDIFYDYGFTTTYLNGNISGVKWKSAGDNIARAYGYSYGPENRLTKADYSQKNSPGADWTNNKLDFSVSGLKYDAGGNILAMKQTGVNVNTITTIDSLKYTYNANTNQLKKIADGISDPTNWGDFKDTTSTGDDYDYDVNGNMVRDNNKHIHSSGGGNGISYNFLDKPTSINVNGKGTIGYTYDAGGALLQKVITDTKLNTETVITYIGSFVYQKVLPSSGNINSVPDTLQYVLHEEGRIRWSYNGANPSGHFVYDYFLKDHLGNIRSVITDEQDTSFYPPASLETATIANEKNYYTGLDDGVVNKSTVSGYPSNDSYTSPNDYIQQLRGDGVKVGAGILLKVMAGDTISVHASSWYNDGGSTPGTPVTPLGNIVSSILGSLPGVSGGKFADGSVANSMINPSVNSFLNERNATENTSHPRSWLNIIVLDEQLKPVITGDGNNSYFEQVGSSGGSSVQQYNPQRPITKNGYVYIYVSNELRSNQRDNKKINMHELNS
ncbi:MAG: hypothetical protein JST21_05305, partial [Bacteroidetes bacterium]|nr:hypothetical protein [Bacteroidota bacterium]